MIVVLAAVGIGGQGSQGGQGGQGKMVAAVRLTFFWDRNKVGTDQGTKELKGPEALGLALLSTYPPKACFVKHGGLMYK